MCPAQRQDDPCEPGGEGDPALVEPESTEPGFQPLDRLEDADDEDMTFEEPKPPSILPDEQPQGDPTLPSPVGKYPEETARSPHVAGLLASRPDEVPPPRILTSDPPSSAYFPLSAQQPVRGGFDARAETKPMSSLPHVVASPDAVSQPGPGTRSPVMPPSTDRVLGQTPAWVEVVPERPAIAPSGFAAAVTPHGPPSSGQTPAPLPSSAPEPAPAPAEGGRRLPVALLATVMFVIGFFGTGALIWWLASRDVEDEIEPSRLEAAPVATTPALGPEPPRVDPPPPPPRPVPPPTPPAPIDAAEARQRAESLLRLGDEEIQRITPHTEVVARDDLEQAVAVPRNHYDAARGYYEQAGRYDRALIQCVHVRMGAAAERIAVVFEATADAPRVQAVDAVRFPQELRDTAANYRGVARRHYQSAAQTPGAFEECARLGAEGFRRTSSALGLPAGP